MILLANSDDGSILAIQRVDVYMSLSMMMMIVSWCCFRRPTWTWQGLYSRVAVLVVVVLLLVISLSLS